MISPSHATPGLFSVHCAYRVLYKVVVYLQALMMLYCNGKHCPLAQHERQGVLATAGQSELRPIQFRSDPTVNTCVF